jgi:hypothetical protein
MHIFIETYNFFSKTNLVRIQMPEVGSTPETESVFLNITPHLPPVYTGSHNGQNIDHNAAFITLIP